MQISDERAQEISTTKLSESSNIRRSRRAIVKGAIAGVAATGLIAGEMSSRPVSYAAKAKATNSPDSAHTILSVARTTERLAVIFYSQVVANAATLGIKGSSLENVRAALIEEQIHENFLATQGGSVLSNDFSFPHGPSTFTNLELFLETFEQFELLGDTTYLAAVKEFAQLGLPDMAQVAAQIAWVEGEHRALGRQIGAELLGSSRYMPADNWAYAPVAAPSVGAAPGILKDAGYMSPVSGNHYTYKAVSTEYQGIIYRKPIAAS